MEGTGLSQNAASFSGGFEAPSVWDQQAYPLQNAQNDPNSQTAMELENWGDVYENMMKKYNDGATSKSDMTIYSKDQQTGFEGVQLQAIKLCPRLEVLYPTFTHDEAQDYLQWWEYYGYPVIGEPHELWDGKHRDTVYRQGTPTDPTYDYYQGFIDEFSEGVLENHYDPSTRKTWEKFPVISEKGKEYGCAGRVMAAKEVERTEAYKRPAKELNYCELKKSTDKIVQKARWNKNNEQDIGKYLSFAGEEYFGLGTIGYKALDWFIDNRSLKSSFSWVYRACGVQSPQLHKDGADPELFDIYIMLRFDLASPTPKSLVLGHNGVRTPHLQVSVLIPKQRGRTWDDKNPYRWRIWKVPEAWAIPGYCLRRMLESQEFPCGEQLYEELAREAIAKTASPWKEFPGLKSWQNTVPHWEDLVPVGDWQRRSMPDELIWDHGEGRRVRQTFDMNVAW